MLSLKITLKLKTNHCKTLILLKFKSGIQSSVYELDAAEMTICLQSHSLSLRRAVSGRIKAFDQLLNEQRERKTLTKDKITNCITKLKDKPRSKLSNEGEASTNPASRMVTVSTSSLSSNASFNNNIVTSSEHQSSQTAALGHHYDTIKRPTTFMNLSRLVV